MVFDLSSLGWKAFQDLCGTVLGTILGQTVIAFRPTRDEGRDYAFEGCWTPASGEALEGKFVVQCKFKARANFYRSDLTPELKKIRRLARSGRCDSYVLMTNAGMTAPTAAEITDDLARQGVKHSLLIGGDRLDLYIRESPRLRALVPRLYGLGDLTQILDERRYEQATALLVSMRDDIEKFVITAPYRRAIAALLDHSFVLLVGAPAAGKSMIATALAAGSVDMWGCRPVKCESADAFSSGWNPLDPSQLFWIDDAFGMTQYQRQRADEWNQLLAKLKAAAGQGTKIVMTSRDYIWAEARDDIKLSAFPVLESGRVVVDVHDLTLDDKRQILYNHLRYGSQPLEFKRAVKPYLDRACHVAVFLPEVARRFGDSQLTGAVEPSARSLVEFFEHPVEHLQEVVRGLGRDEFAALAVLYMSAGSKASPITLGPDESNAVARLGSNLAGVSSSLEALRGSLVVLGASTWSFKHPTIADAVQRQVSARPELLEIYLVGCPLRSLLSEATCGEVGLARALVVPEKHFEVVARRLKEAPADLALQTLIAGFIVTRCSPLFLKRHGSSLRRLDVDPDQPGSLRIAKRLQSLGLLPDSVRQAIVAYYRRLAVDWLDLRLLTEGEIQDLATPDELVAAKEELRDIVNGLDWYIDSIGANYDRSEDPDDVVARVEATLEALQDAYQDDAEVVHAVEVASARVEFLGDSLREYWQPVAEDWNDWRESGSYVPATGSDIFDDVDA